MAITGHPTLLAVLLERKGLKRYGSFGPAYEKAARSLDGRPSQAPSRAQFYRWLTGDLRSMPQTDNCRVLEHLLVGYSVEQLLAPCPDNVVPAPVRELPEIAPTAHAPAAMVVRASMAGVAAVFASRSEFTAAIRPGDLFGGALRIRAAGLSLNLICQSLAEQDLRQMVCGGTELRCLFLDPSGAAIKVREQEEGYTPGTLTHLTQLNIDILLRLRDRLPAEAGDRITLAVYDETIRFNLILVDDHTCVAQPYLPTARGVESPTFLVRHTGSDGLYPVFEQVFDALTQRSTVL